MNNDGEMKMAQVHGSEVELSGIPAINWIEEWTMTPEVLIQQQWVLLVN
jgi:hypothetical protein